MKKFVCPIYRDLNEVVEQTHSLTRMMRKLRKSMLRCPACEHYEDCPVMDQFRRAIDFALEEITHEWASKA